MPIYEYQCGECGHHLEKLQKLADEPLTNCPECGQSTLKKLVSAAGFQLKGTGWYATDFKPKKQNNSSDRLSASKGNASAECPASSSCAAKCAGSASS